MFRGAPFDSGGGGMEVGVGYFFFSPPKFFLFTHQMGEVFFFFFLFAPVGEVFFY